MQLILCSIILSLHFSPRFPSTLLNYLEPQYYTLSLKKSLPRTKDLVFLSFICEFEMLMASRIIYNRFEVSSLGFKKKLLFSDYGSNPLSFFLILGNLENSGRVQRKEKFPQSKDNHI